MKKTYYIVSRFFRFSYMLRFGLEQLCLVLSFDRMVISVSFRLFKRFDHWLTRGRPRFDSCSKHENFSEKFFQAFFFRGTYKLLNPWHWSSQDSPVGWTADRQWSGSTWFHSCLRQLKSSHFLNPTYVCLTYLHPSAFFWLHGWIAQLDKWLTAM